MFYKPCNPEIRRVDDALSGFKGFEWGWDLFFYEKIGYLWIPVNEAGMANISSCELIDSPEDLFKRCLEESIFTLLATKSDFSQNAAEQKAAIRTEWEYVLKQLPEYAELFDQVLESERTGIIQCARILLRNTDNSDLQKLIQDFLGTQYWNFDLTDVFWLSEEYDLENGACAEYLYPDPAFLEICDDRTYLLFFALRDIYRDGYDISGFGLVDDVGSINEQISAFHFCNSETGQMFDMACFGGAFADDPSQMLQPSYLDVKGVQQPAPNIKTAIEKYGKHFRKYNSGFHTVKEILE